MVGILIQRPKSWLPGLNLQHCKHTVNCIYCDSKVNLLTVWQTLVAPGVSCIRCVTSWKKKKQRHKGLVTQFAQPSLRVRKWFFFFFFFYCNVILLDSKKTAGMLICWVDLVKTFNSWCLLVSSFYSSQVKSPMSLRELSLEILLPMANQE